MDGPITWTQGGRTDWQAIFELATIAGCFIVQDGTEVKFFSRRKTVQNKPGRAFRLYDFPDGQLGGQVSQQRADAGGNQGDYPILEFSSPSMWLWIPGSVRGMRVTDTDEGTREESTVNLNDSADPQSRTSAATVAPPEDGKGLPGVNEDTGDGIEQVPGDPGDQSAVEQARAEYDKFSNAGIQVEIGTVGIPDLIPGEIVSVYGVGTKFSDQNYMVMSVRHTAGTGGFETSFEAISNASDFAGGFLARGPQNKAKADGSSGSDDSVEVNVTVSESDTGAGA